MQTGLLYYFLSSSNFSLFERKVTKEANNLRQVDRLFWPRLYTESPLKAKGISLLAVLWGYRSFHSIVLRTGYADRTVTPPTAYFFPTFIGLQISYLFFYGTFPINKIHLKSKCCCPVGLPWCIYKIFRKKTGIQALDFLNARLHFI